MTRMWETGLGISKFDKNRYSLYMLYLCNKTTWKITLVYTNTQTCEEKHWSNKAMFHIVFSRTYIHIYFIHTFYVLSYYCWVVGFNELTWRVYPYALELLHWEASTNKLSLWCNHSPEAKILTMYFPGRKNSDSTTGPVSSILPVIDPNFCLGLETNFHELFMKLEWIMTRMCEKGFGDLQVW